MSKIRISELFLYRQRYIIGYGLVAIGLIAVLVFVGIYSPGGISNQEMQSVIQSDSLSLQDIGSFAISNLPYHALQQLSISLFGVSNISIKLPSIILAFVAAIGIILLLRRWFKPNIGVLISLIAITTSQFLFIAQDGTPGVMHILWPVWLLLFASLISRQSRFRTFNKIAFFITAALSLYTPLSIYILIALTIAIILHPHLRYLIRQLPRTKIVISISIAIILMIPLALSLIRTPGLGLTLLGIPTALPDIMFNLSLIGSQYFGFINPGNTTFLTPFFGLGSMLIIAIGAFSIVKNRSAAKSYVIMSWIIFLLPVILFNPGYISITFLPLVLLLAAGYSSLLAYWYGLFPRNPYARIGGLIPIVILVIVLVASGVDRNIYSYRYDPNIASNFSKDLKLLPTDTRNLVVAESELPFYQVVENHNKEISVSTEPSSDTFTATHKAKSEFIGYEIEKIITTSSNSQSDRFYLYKKI